MKQQFQIVQQRVLNACRRVGRSFETVNIIAVSKTKPAHTVQALYDLGQCSFGENYADEFRQKSEELRKLSLRMIWHFIGPLQRNKVKWVVGRAALIHSVDRIALLDTMSREVSKQGLHSQDCLVQVNLAREGQKSGCMPEELFELLQAFRLYDGKVRCVGLMCIPPHLTDAEQARPYFRQLKELSLKYTAEQLPFVECRELSMGMSEDFEVALEEGATMIRVGRALFGER